MANLNQPKLIRSEITQNRVEFRSKTEFRRFELPYLVPIKTSKSKPGCSITKVLNLVISSQYTHFFL